MEELIEDVLVPTEEVVEMRRGAKVTRNVSSSRATCCASMELTDETWHLVKNTPKVTGFLGAGASRRRLARPKRTGSFIRSGRV